MAFSQTTAVKGMQYIGSNAIALFTCFPLAICVLLVLKKLPMLGKNTMLYWIGICSYEIYLVHAFTLNLIYENTLNLLLFVFSTIILAILLQVSSSVVAQSN